MVLKNLLAKITAKIRNWRTKKDAARFASEGVDVSETKINAQIAQEDAQVSSLADAPVPCMNCQAPLTGPFCHACGQKDDELRRPIWTFLREVLDALFNADSRLIKSTILLIAVPGGLTRAYVMGRRARFVHPLRLYFAITIIFFMVVSIANIAVLDINVTYIPERDKPNVSGQGAETNTLESPSSEAAIALQEEVDQALAELEADTSITEREKDVMRDIIKRGGVAGTALVQRLNGQGLGLTPKAVPKSDGDGVQGFNFELGELPYQIEIAMFKKISDEPREGIKQEHLDKLIRNIEDGDRGRDTSETDTQETSTDETNTGEAETNGGAELSLGDTRGSEISREILETDKQETDEAKASGKRSNVSDSLRQYVKEVTLGFARVLEKPALFNNLLNDWLPRAMLILVPFFALQLRVFHWGKKRYYSNQLVFSLHFHSFLFLLLMALMVIIPRFGGELGLPLFWWGTSLYLIIALKVAQDQGFIRAFLKAGFIWVSYFLVMMGVIGYAVLEGLREL